MTSSRETEGDWSPVPAQGNVPAYYVYKKPIQSGYSDPREYRVIRLQNGLEATLVKDSKEQVAGAAMNVSVGYFQDPDNHPGVAHACEHMLSLGTNKFPKINDFQRYIKANHGWYNANTDALNTTFYFSLASGALKGALEQFAAFFNCPKFDWEATEEVLTSITNEHKGHYQDDGWLLFSVEKALANDDHPQRKFCCGSQETLLSLGPSAKSSRDSNYEGKSQSMRPSSKEYCASRMSLAIVGKDSLDDLARWVAEFFSSVENRGQHPAPVSFGKAYGKSGLGRIVRLKAKQEIYNITIEFPIPSQNPLWHVQPADYLKHFISHKGPGSLYSYLTKKGLINDIDVNKTNIDRDSALFYIYIELKGDAFEKYQEVVDACFKFINVLHKHKYNLPEWAQNEIRQLNRIFFDFNDSRQRHQSAQYAVDIANWMKLQIPHNLLLSGHLLVREWNEKQIQRTLDKLNIENCFIILQAQHHSQSAKRKWITEKWHKACYEVKNIDDKLVLKANNPKDTTEFNLAKENKFIPKNLKVDKMTVYKIKMQPALIVKTQLMEVWHKKDDQFWMPKGKIKILIQTRIPGTSVRAYVMTQLFADLIRDALREYSHDMEVAGVGFGLVPSLRGITMIVGGWNDGVSRLAQRVCETIKNLSIEERRLSIWIDKERRDQMNTLLKQPEEVSNHYLTYLLEDSSFTIEERVKALDGITIKELTEHAKSFLSELNYTILVNGNFYKEEALQIVSLLHNTFKAKPSEWRYGHRSRIPPIGGNYIWELPVRSKDEVNSGVSYYCHVGSSSDPETRVKCKLLAQILEEPANNTLREQEHIGYLVLSDTIERAESIGWRIKIRSDKHPTFVESRIEAFLEKMRKKLEDNSYQAEAEFNTHKRGLINTLTKRKEGIPDETDGFWNAIESGSYDFEQRTNDAGLVESLTRSDILNTFKMFFDPRSATRSKLSVHMVSQNPIVSSRAIDGFIRKMSEKNIKLDKKSLEEKEHYPLSELREYLQRKLAQLKIKQDTVKRLLTKLVEEYPVKDQARVKLSPKVQYIPDGTTFRDILKLSNTTRPVRNLEVET
ncbi:LuxS/MPP-like metallohydrolase [Fomitiporia mediterranea MF3/22]|uniref:LuxS/MPP-like metallohydrolase n=1 Tax=Fomitiporia mediterranea (strain MF3/22) TaxID=694068 RepID=UPI00044096B9|nr:LuxS/MPP-like metallohydrolase [Fomitiporia mediterranea MF3/22]EJD07209.1 LuxS/MPP-like metallohydrolase [Fomitiporia mediterranea MF3/22]